MRVYEYVALENSTYDINLLVNNFSISIETYGGDASWVNGNNEGHNIRIINMVRAVLLGIDNHEEMMLYIRNTSRSL